MPSAGGGARLQVTGGEEPGYALEHHGSWRGARGLALIQPPQRARRDMSPAVTQPGKLGRYNYM
jgi:hypothetical protein